MISTHYTRQRAVEILTDPTLLPLTALALQMDAFEAREFIRDYPTRARIHLENYLMEA